MHSSAGGMTTNRGALSSVGEVLSPGLSMKRKVSTIVISKGVRNVRRRVAVVNPRPHSGGVPRMPLRTSSHETVVENHDDDDDEFDLENDALLASTIPSEAMLAFQTLQQSTDTCLSIPVSGPASDIRGVLDCQLHEWFTGSNSVWSTRMVGEQLQRLRQSNTLRTLAIPMTARVVYITTSDYIRGVREIVTNNSMKTEEEKADDGSFQKMVDWWIRYLSRTPSDRFQTLELEEAWRRDYQSSYPRRRPPDIIQRLQRHQFILAASKDHSTYQLWLPCWGTTVLPALLQASKDVVSFLRRSRAKERSLSSLRERMLQHASVIPVEAVLIPYLVTQGQIQRISRPSGLFLKLLAVP